MKRKRTRLISEDQAKPRSRQHITPCGDCPWTRTSLPGWTGGLSPFTWLQAAHGEERIQCHTLLGPQCVGAAVYRANVCKQPRDLRDLRYAMKPDKARVFGSPQEFLDHHHLPEPGEK